MLASDERAFARQHRAEDLREGGTAAAHGLRQRGHIDGLGEGTAEDVKVLGRLGPRRRRVLRTPSQRGHLDHLGRDVGIAARGHVCLVDDQKCVGQIVLQPDGLLAALRRDLRVRGEHHVGLSLRDRLSFGHDLRHDRRRRALLQHTCVADRVHDAAVRVHDERANAAPLADVAQVARQVREEVGPVGHEDDGPALLQRPGDHAGQHAALADAGVVANDVSAAALDAVHGHRHCIDLLSGESLQ